MYSRTLYDEQYVRCLNSLDALFAKQPGLDPRGVRIALKEPEDAIRLILATAAECVTHMLAAPSQLAGHDVKTYVKAVLSCAEFFDVPVSGNADYRGVVKELASAMRACLESELLNKDYDSYRDRRLAYYDAVTKCVKPVINCLHRTTNALGLGRAAGELRV